jgi:hypothetical protein
MRRMNVSNLNPKKSEQSSTQEMMQRIQQVLKIALEDERTASQMFNTLQQQGIRFSDAKMTKEQTELLDKQNALLLSQIRSQTIAAVSRAAQESPYVKSLQQKFLSTIFPIGGSIINTTYNLYNSTPPIMTPAQKMKLMNIGEKIAGLPKKMLSGEYDLKKGYEEFVVALKELTHFVTDRANLNIVINIGSTLLESFHPLGAFIKSALQEIMKEPLPKTAQEGLMKGLNIIAKNFDKLEKGLKKAAESKLAQVNKEAPKPN